MNESIQGFYVVNITATMDLWHHFCEHIIGNKSTAIWIYKLKELSIQNEILYL